jgi:hypothetical protein
MKNQTFINFSLILTCILLICAYATPNDDSDSGIPESLPSAGATLGDVEENLVRLIASKLEDKESLQNVRLTCRQFKQATSITEFQRALYEEIHDHLKDCAPSGPLKSTLDRLIAEKTRCAHDPFEAIVTMATAVGRVEKILFGRDFSPDDRLFTSRKFIQGGPDFERLRNIRITHFVLAHPFYAAGFYFLPFAGDDMLKSRAEHVVRNFRKFFQHPKDFIGAINSPQMRKFLIQSILHNIYGNLPLCSRLKRLSALAEKLLPVLQDTTIAGIWKRYHGHRYGAGDAYLQSDSAPSNIPFPEIEIGGQLVIWRLDETEPVLASMLAPRLSPNAPPVPFITFDAVIHHLTQDINQILSDRRVLVRNKQKVKAVLKRIAFRLTPPIILFGILASLASHLFIGSSNLPLSFKICLISAYSMFSTVFGVGWLYYTFRISEVQIRAFVEDQRFFNEAIENIL